MSWSMHNREVLLNPESRLIPQMLYTREGALAPPGSDGAKGCEQQPEYRSQFPQTLCHAFLYQRPCPWC